MALTTITIAVFTIMNFVLSMTASVFGSILDLIAVSLNVSVETAGLLTTMYSYGAACGVPITLIVFRKADRSKLLKIMLAVTIVMSLLLILANSFWQMLIIRLIMGVTAYSYNVLAIAIVASLSTKEKQGRTMAVLIAGNAAALAVGIPLTRALSSVLDWRGVFVILILMMLAALIYFTFRLPRSIKPPVELSIRDELAFFKDKSVLLVIVFSLIMFIGYGALYTYITPFLLAIFPSCEQYMSLILVLVGIASFVGNLIGGIVSDRIGYSKSMLLGGVVQLALLALLLVFRSSGYIAVALSALWIMSAWFIGLQVNTGIAQATQNRSGFMISLNTSSIQLGTAIGASLAALLGSAAGMENIIYISIITSVIIIVLHLFASKKN